MKSNPNSSWHIAYHQVSKRFVPNLSSYFSFWRFDNSTTNAIFPYQWPHMYLFGLQFRNLGHRKDLFPPSLFQRLSLDGICFNCEWYNVKNSVVGFALFCNIMRVFFHHTFPREVMESVVLLSLDASNFLLSISSISATESSNISPHFPTSCRIFFLLSKSFWSTMMSLLVWVGIVLYQRLHRRNYHKLNTIDPTRAPHALSASKRVATSASYPTARKQRTTLKCACTLKGRILYNHAI